MSGLRQFSSYLFYWLNVVDEHSIHSPFFYDFHQKTIKSTGTYKEFDAIEKLRGSLLENKMQVANVDFGAGSKSLPNNSHRLLSDIAKASVSPPVMSQLYYRIIQQSKSKYIVELGTSIGLNTLYLAIHPDTRVFTFEGNPALNNIALTHFEYFEKKNIFQVPGNIDVTLPEFLQNPSKINFALIDANHRYEPTIRYFNLLQKRLTEKSIMVIDDIHWSAEMEKAWKELSRHELVYGSIDLYRCGILFFDPALNRQHFILSL